MQMARIRSLSAYNNYKTSNAAILNKVWLKEKEMSAAANKLPFTVRGFSYPAEELVDFQVDFLYSDGSNVNWRERVVCPVTGLNNRLRAAIHLIDMELGLRPHQDIYIAEQVTPLYTYLKKRYPRLVGSEYFGPHIQPGEINQQQLRHESATQLSFANESLDAYLSFECFEHIPDFRTAFAEAGRVLKTGGKFMWSVPFAELQYDNIIRATADQNGQITHLLEPEYHGDPVSADGILCFTHFGWEMLDQVRAEGFSDVYAVLFRSEIFGYLGGEQILFVAEKDPGAAVKRTEPPTTNGYATEKINCLFCGSDQATPFSSRADIVTCSSCGIVYLRTRPTQESMYRIYQSYANETSHMRPPDTVAASQSAGLRRPWFIEEVTAMSKRSGTWLDIGCGWGALLDEARKKGYQPKGIEITRNCQDFASMQLQLPVSNAQFLDAAIDKASCAIVSMVHVLEHLPYPKQTLEKLYDIIEPGGMFCGIVPNIASFCSTHFKNNWVWLDPTHHYVHYSPGTLTAALEKAGFTVLKVYTSEGDYDHNDVIDCICANTPGIDSAVMAEKLIPELEASGQGEEIRFFALKK